MEMKFYKCKHCGKIIMILNDTKVPTICCGDAMDELIPCTSDGAREKHVPQFTVDGNKITVDVGEVPHPMADVHYIQWILIQTKKGIQKKDLNPNDVPSATFALTDDDKLVAVFAYCNLHGLWKNQ